VVSAADPSRHPNDHSDVGAHFIRVAEQQWRMPFLALPARNRRPPAAVEPEPAVAQPRPALARHLDSLPADRWQHWHRLLATIFRDFPADAEDLATAVLDRLRPELSAVEPALTQLLASRRATQLLTSLVRRRRVDAGATPKEMRWREMLAAQLNAVANNHIQDELRVGQLRVITDIPMEQSARPADEAMAARISAGLRRRAIELY
jgi:hypothetical protein